MKLVIISDAHFPVPYSMLFRQIIEREHPDHLVFLGDNVQADRGEDLMRLHKQFIAEIKRLHPLSRTVYLIGDNDYAQQSEIKRYISRNGFMNKDPARFHAGNMDFFHGNIEERVSFGSGRFNRILEQFGYRALKASGRIGKRILPKVVSGTMRFIHHVPRHNYLFLGHIHLLNRSGNDIFCGTLKAKKIIFEPYESIGYVTVKHSDFVIASPDSIKIHDLSAHRVRPA